MWRKLFKILGWRVIQTQDMDMEVRTRFLRKDAFGLYCVGLYWVPRVRLNPDGTIARPSYIERWKEI